METAGRWALFLAWAGSAAAILWLLDNLSRMT